MTCKRNGTMQRVILISLEGFFKRSLEFLSMFQIHKSTLKLTKQERKERKATDSLLTF